MPKTGIRALSPQKAIQVVMDLDVNQDAPIPELLAAPLKVTVTLHPDMRAFVEEHGYQSGLSSWNFPRARAHDFARVLKGSPVVTGLPEYDVFYLKQAGARDGRSIQVEYSQDRARPDRVWVRIRIALAGENCPPAAVGRKLTLTSLVMSQLSEGRVPLGPALRRVIGHSFSVAVPVAGRPAHAELLSFEYDPGSFDEPVSVTSEEVQIATLNRRKGVEVHSQLEDIRNMLKSTPYTGDSRLEDYQKEAVGRHLSTKLGYIQASDPGTGKTVMQLAAMAARAKEIPRYRGLVVVEGNVRTQWQEEVGRWFPDAECIPLLSGSDKAAAKLGDALCTDKPLVVITSYGLMPRVLEAYEERAAAAAGGVFDISESVGQYMISTHWHDICADEAECLRGTAKQAQALWKLRSSCDVATVLSGTPINKGLKDLDRLVSWARNDRNMFRGSSLEQLEPEEAMDALGPLIFRRTAGDAGTKMPPAKATIVRVSPSPQELEVEKKIRLELKRVYQEFLVAVEQKEKAEQNEQVKDQLVAARKRLQEARTAWMGSTQLARMAASDASIVRHSTSAAAKLVQASGLFKALEGTVPVKQTKLLELVTERVSNNQQVLVFTEFAGVADRLRKALEDEGFRTGIFKGGSSHASRDALRVAFQEGDLDVLVATAAGEKGLTLHKASTIIHYDMPWVPKSIIQRVGRIARYGSEHDEVENIFLIATGTVEEHVSDVVVARADVALRALDNDRAKGSSTAQSALSDLVDVEKTRGQALLQEMTEKVIADI